METLIQQIQAVAVEKDKLLKKEVEDVHQRINYRRILNLEIDVQAAILRFKRGRRKRDADIRAQRLQEYKEGSWAHPQRMDRPSEIGDNQRER